MSLTPYQLGVNVEHAAMAKLEKAGWFVVRAAKSKGPADLVAMKGLLMQTLEGETLITDVILVNCKRNVRACDPADWNRTFHKARECGAEPVIAGRVKNKRGIRFFRMMEPKTGQKKSQPMEEMNDFDF